MKSAHIDVRGPWPTYIDGFNCITMVGAPRDITIEQAQLWGGLLGGMGNWKPSNPEQEILRFGRDAADVVRSGNFLVHEGTYLDPVDVEMNRLLEIARLHKQ